MAEEDSFDDLDDEQDLLKRIKELECQKRELTDTNKLLEDDHESNMSILGDIRDYFEVRFPVLKGHQPDDFLDVAFRELDKLQDSHDEIMNYVTYIFPDLKDVAQKDISAAVISKIDEIKKKYSELESQVQLPPAEPSVAPSDRHEQELSQISAENAELKSSEKNLKDTLQEIRTGLEMRFWSLKETPPESFLIAAFKELDELQDGNEGLMEYLRDSFPELKDKPHKEASAAAITILDTLKKRYSELEEQSKSAKPSEELPENYKQEIEVLKQHALTLEEQLRLAKEKPAEPSDQYKNALAELKQKTASLEEQLKLAKEKPAEPSDNYKQELDVAKKELEETKQRLTAEMQGREKQVAESSAASASEISAAQEKLAISDAVARYILGDECFIEYQKQNFSSVDERQNWIAKRVYDAFIPINENDPQAHINARLHAEARKKKLDELAPKINAGLDEYLNSVQNLGKVLVQKSDDISRLVCRLNELRDQLGQSFKQYDE